MSACLFWYRTTSLSFTSFVAVRKYSASSSFALQALAWARTQLPVWNVPPQMQATASLAAGSVTRRSTGQCKERPNTLAMFNIMGVVFRAHRPDRIRIRDQPKIMNERNG